MLCYKEEGYTMKQFMDNVKIKLKNDNILFNKLAFTARLDPMALGFVPILIDDDCKKMDNALTKSKKYTVKIIIGIKTDSDDILGLIQKISVCNNYNNYINKLKTRLIEYCSNTPVNIKQKFHYFSTKQLLARGKNNDTQYYHNVSLKNINILEINKLDSVEFINHIINKINIVDKNKNFRQNTIISQYKWFLNQNEIKIPEYLNYIKVELDVSSGFFIRQFVCDLSDELNIPLMCFQITRTHIY